MKIFSTIIIGFGVLVAIATIFWDLCVNEPAKYPCIDKTIRKLCGASMVLMLIVVTINGWWC